MRDMPKCLAWRNEREDGAGWTVIEEGCECGQVIRSEATTRELAERIAQRQRAQHTTHRHTVQT